MNHRVKRQEMAKKLREQHRRSIISANRTKVPSEKLYTIHQYAYTHKIMGYETLPLGHQLTQAQIQQKIQLISTILAPLPPYITHFAKQQNKGNSQKDSVIVQKIVQICCDCFNLGICMKQSSECLVQLSTLNNLYKYFPTIEAFQALIQQKIGTILIQQIPNIEICVNCIYIIGNSYEQLVRIRQNVNPLKDDQNVQIEQVAINYLEKLCAQYPFYHDCMLLLLWFFRNCLLVGLKSVRNQINIEMDSGWKSDNVRFCNRAILVMKSLVVTICSKIAYESNSAQYLLTSLNQTLQLLCLIVTYIPILYTSQIAYHELLHQLQNNNPLWHIDEAISIIISIDKLLQNKVISDTTAELANSLISLIYSHTNKPIKNSINFWGNIHSLPSVQKFCSLVASGKVRGSVCFEALQKILEETFFKQNLRKFLIGQFMKNLEFFFKQDKAIVQSRSRRISLIKTMMAFTGEISSDQIKRTIADYILSLPFYRPNSPLSERRAAQLEIEMYFRGLVVPVVLNIIELVLIDMDYDVVEMGLKIIVNMLENWEIDKDMIEEYVKKCGMDGRIIEICSENCSQRVFELASTLSDTLNLQ